MKYTLLAILATSLSVSAATLNVTTNGNFGIELLDNSGTPIVANTGFAAVGVWSGPSDLASSGTLLTPEQLVSGFAIAADNEGDSIVSIVNGTGFGTPKTGTFAINNVDDAAAGYPGGAPVDILVFVGPSIDQATEAMIYRLDGVTYPEGPTITPVTYNGQGGTLLYGRSGVQTNVLDVVPEPSAALLAGLALVGGLVRRRR